MLRTRVIVGSILAAAAVGLLYFDESQSPKFPGLFILSMLMGVLGTRELLHLLPIETRPRAGITIAGVVFVLAANWYDVASPFHGSSIPAHQPLAVIFLASVAVIWLAFLVELWDYRGPGGDTVRLSNTAFVVLYLGIFPAFLIRLRWLPVDISGVALALAIFVPKCCDIGAYFTGRMIGRTPMSPRLSPKKTWEGFAGGTLLAIAAAVGLGQLAPVFRGGIVEAVAFGVVVGWVGVLGDLAESMMKRDAMAKDASATVPGFGGVLDVIDSVIFAAPVVYLWLSR